MNNKFVQIDNFLKMWRDIALENSNIDFFNSDSRQMTYNYLIKLNVKKEDRKLDIGNMYFSDWTKKFKNKKNINCFVDPDWSYFCQFKNGNCYVNEYIKVYVPLDGKHIKEGTNIIFDFLAKNNIVHISKVSKRIRFDDIVIRLTNAEDANKLMNFIQNNSYIQEGLIPANPFAYNKDGLALACDGELSYNDTVASCISIYIDSKKKNQCLSDIGVNDFSTFLRDYYSNVFINGNYEKFIKDFSLKKHDDDLQLKIANYKQVLALIIKSFSYDFSYNDYLEHFKMCSFKRIDAEYLSKQNINITDVENTESMNNDALEKLLLETIEVMTNKYSRDVAINSVQNYLLNGMSDRITRDGNLRYRVQKAQLREYLNNVLRQNNLSLIQYIGLLEQKNIKQNLDYSKKEILISGLINTYNKYQGLSNDGKEYMLSALKFLVFRNNYSGFTRDNNVRETIKNNIAQLDVIELLKEHYGYEQIDNLSLNTLCDRFIEEVIVMQKSLS